MHIRVIRCYNIVLIVPRNTRDVQRRIIFANTNGLAALRHSVLGAPLLKAEKAVPQNYPSYYKITVLRRLSFSEYYEIIKGHGKGRGGTIPAGLLRVCAYKAALCTRTKATACIWQLVKVQPREARPCNASTIAPPTRTHPLFRAKRYRSFVCVPRDLAAINVATNVGKNVDARSPPTPETRRRARVTIGAVHSRRR